MRGVQDSNLAGGTPLIKAARAAVVAGAHAAELSGAHRGLVNSLRAYDLLDRIRVVHLHDTLSEVLDAFRRDDSISP